MLRVLPPALIAVAVFATATALARDADQIPPATAQRLSNIVRVIEQEGHAVIPEVRFADGVWNFRVYKRGLEFEIKVDPVTAEILSIRPR